MPEPFTGVAAGSAYADDTPYAVLVYSHTEDAAAAANADALRALLEEGEMANGRPWRDWFGVADIRVDGTTVTARLTLGEALPSAPYRVLFQRENLTTLG